MTAMPGDKLQQALAFVPQYYLFRHPAISLHRKSVILEEMKRAQEMTLNWAGVSCIQFFM